MPVQTRFHRCSPSLLQALQPVTAKFTGHTCGWDVAGMLACDGEADASPLLHTICSGTSEQVPQEQQNCTKSYEGRHLTKWPPVTM